MNSPQFYPPRVKSLQFLPSWDIFFGEKDKNITLVIVNSLSVYFLQFFPFGDFLRWKWTKLFLVMVNALKFWYLFKLFGLFYLKFCVGVFFSHNWPFFFCLIRWHFSPFKGQLLKIVTFLRFYFGENGQKITLGLFVDIFYPSRVNCS